MYQEVRERKVKKKRVRKQRRSPVDFWLLLFILSLTIFGVIMVFSASYYWSIDRFGSPYFFLKKELFWSGSGLLIMFFFACVDYRKIGQKSVITALVIALAGLLLLLTPLGSTINGAKRWISIGGVTIMPGEIAKFAMILFVAWFLSEKPIRIKKFITGLLPIFVVCGVFGALIMLQPNMSTAGILMLIIFAMLFAAGLNLYYLVGGGILVVIYGITQAFIGYRQRRIVSFLDPFKDEMGDGWQVVQSLLALGSGGLTGRGLGKSVTKNLYLPEPQNDFILAIIGEELGYIIVLVIIVIYILIIWRGIRIAMLAQDRYGMLLAAGITSMIGIQVILNIAVVTSSMPPTGVTLPFISYGGNAMWLFMACGGILLNISGKQKSEGEKR